jgi:2',3'-cyclic-nucleotide 2'-phosphodiesterase (5'-nucleotidase family)
MPKAIFLSAIIFLIAACTIGEVKRNIYSHPNWVPQASSQHIKRIVIASTHGFQHQTTAKNDSIPLKGQLSDHHVQVGGIKIISNYLSILKKRYKDNLLLLDTGAFLKNNQSEKEINSLLEFYSRMDYDGIAFSEREIQGLLPHSKAIDEKNIPFINSNILDIKTNRTVQRSSIIPNRVITINGIKVGIISASLPKSNKSTTQGLYFEDPVLTFLKNKKSLKKQGVQVTLLLANLYSSCHVNTPEEGSSILQNDLTCRDEQDNLTKLLNRLPKGSIDAVIGHGINITNGFIGNTPIIQVPGGLPYLSRMELYYDTVKQKLVTEKSHIYAPTKLCHHFFLATNDCHIKGDVARLKSIEKSNFQLIPARFLGLEVTDKVETTLQAAL